LLGACRCLQAGKAALLALAAVAGCGVAGALGGGLAGGAATYCYVACKAALQAPLVIARGLVHCTQQVACAVAGTVGMARRAGGAGVKMGLAGAAGLGRLAAGLGSGMARRALSGSGGGSSSAGGGGSLITAAGGAVEGGAVEVGAGGGGSTAAAAMGVRAGGRAAWQPMRSQRDVARFMMLFGPGAF
jgi:hypothetical protein